MQVPDEQVSADTNVFLIKEALVISHANIFHVSKLVRGLLEGGGGRGRFDGSAKVFVRFSRSKINSHGVENL